MTPKQYTAALQALGLTQKAAGELLGVSLRTSQGYAIGDYRVPDGYAKLLRLMIRLSLKPDEVK
jgi:hypothetical protein